MSSVDCEKFRTWKSRRVESFSPTKLRKEMEHNGTVTKCFIYIDILYICSNKIVHPHICSNKIRKFGVSRNVIGILWYVQDIAHRNVMCCICLRFVIEMSQICCSTAHQLFPLSIEMSYVWQTCHILIEMALSCSHGSSCPPSSTDNSMATLWFQTTSWLSMKIHPFPSMISHYNLHWAYVCWDKKWKHRRPYTLITSHYSVIYIYIYVKTVYIYIFFLKKTVYIIY